MKTHARDYFATDFEWRQLCGDAQSQARTEKEQEFAADMMLKANQYGLDTFVSQDQLKWLCRIADWNIPKRRSDNGTEMQK